MPFLGARPHPAPAATVIGAPYDATASHRRGAAAAPAAIRWMSGSLETYSPAQERDLEDLAFADAGDLDLADCAPEAMIERVEAAVAGAAGLPMLLGGEHTVTVGAVEALAGRHADLAVVLLDAHLDLRDAYEGQRWSHATAVRRIAERVGMDRIAVLGARSGTRGEWQAAEALAVCSRTATVTTAAWAALASRPLYLSVDIDAFDPALAPGVGNPEPLGLAVEDFTTLLSVLREARVVGCDLVEVCPPFDPSGQTATLAAWLVREMLLAFVR
ncbi:MAG: agmatinase [Armatimonadota bacterium]|nr:agmatinase [Armatimonadota bacterium]